jgi:amino acid transporter
VGTLSRLEVTVIGGLQLPHGPLPQDRVRHPRRLRRGVGREAAGGGFAPFGAHGVFAALPLGVMFALQGFEQAVQLGDESRNPQREPPDRRVPPARRNGPDLPRHLRQARLRPRPLRAGASVGRRDQHEGSAVGVAAVRFRGRGRRLPAVPSWQDLVSLITSAVVMMYGFAPVTLVALPRSDPTASGRTGSGGARHLDPRVHRG